MNVFFSLIRKSAECNYKDHKISGNKFKVKHNCASNTCSVFPGYRTDRIFKIHHHLVAEVQVVVPGFIHQVATTQVTVDHLVLGHCSSEELNREQREAHLKERPADALNSGCKSDWVVNIYPNSSLKHLYVANCSGNHYNKSQRTQTELLSKTNTKLRDFKLKKLQQ